MLGRDAALPVGGAPGPPGPLGPEDADDTVLEDDEDDEDVLVDDTTATPGVPVPANNGLKLMEECAGGPPCLAAGCCTDDEKDCWGPWLSPWVRRGATDLHRENTV